MKLRCCCLAAAMVLSSGCGKEERREAVGFYKVLVEKRAGFAETNGLEKSFVGSVRSWCESLMANGSGRGAQLAQNASVARDLAKSAESISAQVGQVRQAVYNQTIQKEYPQSIRNALIGQLTKRQRFLQELRAGLDDAAAGFESLGQSREYKGDSYPNAIGKLNVLVQGYKEPGDAVADAVTALGTKYGIKDADLGT
ncbi:MAG: hypothetical protein LAQ69_42585 [Acidobacteriia bacterium]|nr:hypothetical protein [Terriglobia bacterium]